MSESTTMFDEFDDVLTVDDIAKILKIGRNKAYNLVHAGTIKSIRIGKIYRIPKSSIVEYIESLR